MAIPENRTPREPIREPVVPEDTSRLDDTDRVRVERVASRDRWPAEERAPLYEFAQISVRWPGVFVGLLVAVGILVLLSALGVAVGATTASGGIQGLGQGAAWWAGSSFLVALFVGGMVSARWVTGTLTSVLQGSMVWVLAIISVMYLAGAGISLGAEGLFASMGPGMSPGSALQQMAQDMGQTGAAVGTAGAADVADTIATTAWAAFIVLCVSALAAIGGALIGQRKDVRATV